MGVIRRSRSRCAMMVLQYAQIRDGAAQNDLV